MCTEEVQNTQYISGMNDMIRELYLVLRSQQCGDPLGVLESEHEVVYEHENPLQKRVYGLGVAIQQMRCTATTMSFMGHLD